jgi:hypothetical protein
MRQRQGQLSYMTLDICENRSSSHIGAAAFAPLGGRSVLRGKFAPEHKQGCVLGAPLRALCSDKTLIVS